MEAEEKPRVTAELNRRFLCNDADEPITWPEWHALKEFYDDLERKVCVLGRDFYLVKVELDRRLIKLRFIAEQMKEKDKKRERNG